MKIFKNFSIQQWEEKLLDKDRIIKEKDEHIKELEAKLENIAIKAVTKSTTTNITQNNNRIQTINNLIPITDEHLKEQAKFLTLDHIKQGPSGYSQYAIDYPLRDRVACTDFARRKIKYKNSEGQLVTDPEMATLSQKLFSAIQSENKKLCHQYAQELQDLIMNETKNAKDDMNEEESELFTIRSDKFVDIITDIYSQVRQINELSQGKKPEMYEDIIKQICTI